jgi:flagellin
MAITVNTNIYSLTAQRNISRVNSDMQTAIERLSSGMRINQAKDDAAGLTMAQSMEGQARGFAVAQRTIADGQSYLQVADSTLRNANDMLQRMRELSVQYTSDLYNADQKAAMSTEFAALQAEIADSQGRATFNGSTVFGGGGDVAVDANGGVLNVTANSVDVSAADIATTTTVDTAITAVGTELANIGSLQSRLEQSGSVASAIETAQWASYGRVMDADMAKETSRLTSAQVIQQAGASALAQANGLPQIALGLL